MIRTESLFLRESYEKHLEVDKSSAPFDHQTQDFLYIYKTNLQHLVFPISF